MPNAMLRNHLNQVDKQITAENYEKKLLVKTQPQASNHK